MKNLIRFLLGLTLCPALYATSDSSIPDPGSKAVTFTVTDFESRPVEGAFVEASRHGPGNAEGYTGKDGQVVLNLTKGANLSVYVSKKGYYRTGGRLWSGGVHRGPDGNLIAREVPDSFSIELKPVLDPVPMIHKQFRDRAPVTGEPVGFDLETGDWVAPHGTGKTADLLFHFHDISVTGHGFTGTMTVSFPNEGDGIQAFHAPRPFSMEFGSDLAPPHVAPADGYQPDLTHTLAHREGEPYQSYKEKNRNYLIRTRTGMDASQRILKACYGWIQGEIEFDPRDPSGPQIAFSYFFNPDPSPEARSLEYNLHAPR